MWHQGVASTTDPTCWACGYCNSKMTVYMVAMMSALFAAAIFMMLACFTAMPVSTTHAIIGGTLCPPGSPTLLASVRKP